MRNDGRVGGARFLRKAVVKDNAGFANQRTFAVLAFIDRYTQNSRPVICHLFILETETWVGCTSLPRFVQPPPFLNFKTKAIQLPVISDTTMARY